MAYDKTTDPFRVSERHARRRLDQEVAENGFIDAAEFRLVTTLGFTPGGDGSYATFRAVCVRDEADAPFVDRRYSVHDAVLVSEADGIKGARLINGEYDLTRDEAFSRAGR